MGPGGGTRRAAIAGAPGAGRPCPGRSRCRSARGRAARAAARLRSFSGRGAALGGFGPRLPGAALGLRDGLCLRPPAWWPAVGIEGFSRSGGDQQASVAMQLL